MEKGIIIIINFVLNSVHFLNLKKDEDCRKETCLKLGPKYWGYIPDCDLLPDNSICNPTDNCATFTCKKGLSSS